MSSPMDAATCRAHLQNLLAEETVLLTQLELQLGREHELLSKNDIDGLEAAGDARQQTVASLLRLEGERRALCGLMVQPADASGVAALLRWSDPTASLASAQADVASRAARCREQNDRNGALVMARLARVQNMLGLLDNSGHDSRTYTAAAGRFPSASPHSGKLLALRA